MRSRQRAEEHRILARRARVAAWMLLGAVVGLSVVNPLLNADALGPRYATKAAMGAVAVAALWYSRAASRRGLVRMVVAMTIFVAAMVAVAAILAREPWLATYTATLTTLGSAALLPWGARAQVVAAGGTMVCAIVAVGVLGPDNLMPVPGIVLAAVASVFIARENERHRAESWRRIGYARESTERLRQIAEHVNGVLWLNDLKQVGGTLLYVSSGYDVVWGRDRRMLHERPDAWLEAVHPDDRREVEVLYRRGLTGGDYDCEYRLVRPDGAVRWIHDRAFPIDDTGGSPRRIARLSQDVTAEKEAVAVPQLHELARRLQATREDERGRIARELHDELGQVLTGIKMHLAAARWSVEHDEPDGADAIDTCIGEIEGTIDAVRGMAHWLRPPMLDDLGLVAALRTQVETFAARTGVDCELEALDVEPELSAEEVTALYRIAQEALTNVARHAEASHVAVRLTVTDEHLRLSVEDDGQGVRDSEGTLGVAGMSERAALLQGTLAVDPRDGGGTVVRLDIPRAHIDPRAACAGAGA